MGLLAAPNSVRQPDQTPNVREAKHGIIYIQHIPLHCLTAREGHTTYHNTLSHACLHTCFLDPKSHSMAKQLAIHTLDISTQRVEGDTSESQVSLSKSQPRAVKGQFH